MLNSAYSIVRQFSPYVVFYTASHWLLKFTTMYVAGAKQLRGYSAHTMAHHSCLFQSLTELKLAKWLFVSTVLQDFPSIFSVLTQVEKILNVKYDRAS
jgi:hypothetical protein